MMFKLDLDISYLHVSQIFQLDFKYIKENHHITYFIYNKFHLILYKLLDY